MEAAAKGSGGLGQESAMAGARSAGFGAAPGTLRALRPASAAGCVKAPAPPPGASFLFAPWFFVPVTQRGTLQAGNGLGADHRSGVAFVAVGVTRLPVLRVKYCYLFTHPQPYRGVINVQ